MGGPPGGVGVVNKCRKLKKYEEKIQHLLKVSEEKTQEPRTIYTPDLGMEE